LSCCTIGGGRYTYVMAPPVPAGFSTVTATLPPVVLGGMVTVSCVRPATVVVWNGARTVPKRTALVVARLSPVIRTVPPPAAKPVLTVSAVRAGAANARSRRCPRPCIASSTARYLGVWAIGWSSYSTRPQEPEFDGRPPEAKTTSRPPPSSRHWLRY